MILSFHITKFLSFKASKLRSFETAKFLLFEVSLVDIKIKDWKLVDFAYWKFIIECFRI